MLSQEELIRRAANVVTAISDMSEDARNNVSAQHMANEIAYARLLFDMSESDAYWRLYNKEFQEKVKLYYAMRGVQTEGVE